MDEKKSSSPWDQLVEELGVQPDSTAFERRQPPPQDLPTAAKSLEHVSPPPAAASDWGALAANLGIEVPPAVSKAPAASPQQSARSSETVKPKSRKSEGTTSAGVEKANKPVERPLQSSLFEEIEQEDAEQEHSPKSSPEESEAEDRYSVSADFTSTDSASTDEAYSGTEETEAEREKARISGEAARSAFDALFSSEAAAWGSAFVIPRSNEDSAVDYSEIDDAEFAEEATEVSDIEEEDRPKRRRPRRRRRGGSSSKAKDESAATEDSSKDSEIVFEEIFESETGENIEEADPELAAEATADLPEKKRRRRPRRRGRRGSDESAAEDSESQNLDDDSDEDELAGDDNPDSHSTRNSHRNIPTWLEAVGEIVDANMADRTKSPSKPSSPRGRGRGGRRHKKT